MHTLSRHSRAIAGVFAAAAALLVVLSAATAGAATSNVGLGFRATGISGFRTGAVRLSGGGSFDPVVGTGHLGGGFRCTSAVDQGPLQGCQTDQGVRWDTDAMLRQSPFKCTGADGEALKFAHTSAETAVLRADFYRAGDGIDESFRANMIVSTTDLAPEIPGVQNVWVQGVGCATGDVHFSA